MRAKKKAKIVTKKRAKKAAVTAPEDTKAPVASVHPSEALLVFRGRIAEWHQSSISAVAAAAVTMVLTAFAKDGRTRATYDETVEALKKQTAERGLKTAQVYKLVGLARGLVKKMAEDHPLGGPVYPVGSPIRDVIDCPTIDECLDVIVAYYKEHRIKTLDDLGNHVGLYRRSDTPEAPVAPAPAAKGAAAAPPAAGQAPASPKGNGNGTPVAPGDGLPHLPSGPAMAPENGGGDLGSFMPDQIVASAIAAGHTAIAIGGALVAHFQTVAEIGMMIRLLTDKAEHMNRPVEQVAAAAPVPLDAKRRQGAARQGATRQRQKVAA